MRCLLLGFLFLSTGVLAADCIEEGNRAREVGDLDRAAEIFKRCAEEAKERLIFTQILLGITNHDRGEFKVAIENYTEAIRVEADQVIPFYNRGLAYSRDGQYDKAIEDYTLVTSAQSESLSVNAYYYRGVAYRKQGKLDLALSDLSQVIRDDPQHAWAHYQRGLIYRKQKKSDLALNDYSKAIELDDTLVAAYYSRGIMRKNQRDWRAAIDDYSSAIALNPKHAEAYNNRGVAYRKLGEYDHATRDYKKARELGAGKFRTAYNTFMVKILPLIPLLIIALV